MQTATSNTAKERIERMTWRPMCGESVTVVLKCSGGRTWEVYGSTGAELGTVYFADASWRWRRAGHDERRGSGLGQRDSAVSELLRALREAGNI